MVNSVFLYLSCLRQDPRSIHVYASLGTEESPSPYTYDSGQTPSFEPHEARDATFDIVPFSEHPEAANIFKGSMETPLGKMSQI